MEEKKIRSLRIRPIWLRGLFNLNHCLSQMSDFYNFLFPSHHGDWGLFVMSVFCSWILSLQVWWFLSFVWWNSWTALLNMTTEKNMLSSSWFGKTCFLASWWRPHSWPWATHTAPRLRHKVLMRLCSPPPVSSCVSWFEEECGPWNYSLNRGWRRRVRFSIFPKQWTGECSLQSLVFWMFWEAFDQYL